MAHQRVWRITAEVGFPVGVAGPPGHDMTQGVPSQLLPASRFPGRQTADVGGVSVVLDRALDAPALAFGDRWERLQLTLELSALTAESAVDAARLHVERILDDLSFRLQLALPVGQAEALDVTPPLEVGAHREVSTLGAFPRWKFSGSTAMQDQVEFAPGLRPAYPDLSDRHQRALDWYVKGLGAFVDADRFVFMWVALEVLEHARNGRIEIPYTAPCGHEIAACPQCGTSTEKIVAGANIQAFLRDDLGVSNEDGRELWLMRQMIHGDRAFASDKMRDLPRLVQLLRAATTRALKGAMGIALDQPPLVPEQGLSIAGGSVGGTREITAADAVSL